MKIEELKSKVDSMLEERSSEIKRLQAEIEDEKNTVEKATEAMDAASDASDLKAFQKAKRDKENASDALQMHQARLRKLSEDPMISKEEYLQMISDISTEMDLEVEAAKPQLAEASEKLASIGAEISTDAEQANDLLKTIQHELYRDADRQKNSNGMFIGNPKSYRGHYDVTDWSKAGIQHYMYDQYKKEGK